MNFTTALQEHSIILSECAVSERLRRLPDIELHPTLFNTPLIYQEKGRKRLDEIYRSYIEVAREAKLPLLLCAPTWRVDRVRIEEAGVPYTINGDAAAFMKEIQKRYSKASSPVIAGALLAPRNDCYSAEAALARIESAEVHGWQIDRLAETDAEVIIAQTMPAVSESLGMADRLGPSAKPYIISFVIDSSGKVLDGTPLTEAVQIIDQEATRPPIGYMVNCVYPTFIRADEQPPALFTRLIGIQANSSSKDHAQLDGAEELQQDPLPDWGAGMLRLNRDFGVKILGGCCGTDHTYLRYLTESLRRG
jgi:S-methylmethionine-dependent homocysteine/selenocysteine methylase